MSLFKDLGKANKDLLEKDFPTERKVEVNTKAKNVTLKWTGTINDDNSVKGVVEPTYKHDALGLTVTGEISTANAIKIDASSANKLLDGLKISAVINTNKEGPDFRSSFEYKNQWGSASTEAFIPKANGTPVLTASTVVKVNKFEVGAQASYSLGDAPSLKSVDAVVQFKEGDYIATGYLQTRGENNVALGTTYFHQLPKGQVGVNAKYDLRSASGAAGKVSLSVGGQTSLKDGATLKARLNSEGRLGVSYGYRLSETARFTAAADVATTDLGNGKGNKFGFHLVVDA